MHVQVPIAYQPMRSSDGSGTDLQVRHTGSYAVFEIDGPLALGWVADELCREVRQVLDGGGKNLILDLAQVPYLDSAGVGVLAAALKLVRAAGGKMVLLSVQHRVLHMLKRLRLEQFFTFSNHRTFAQL